MDIQLLELLDNPENMKHATTIRTDYQTFKENEIFIKKFFGNKAKGFFIEKSAYILFEESPNILVIVNKEHFNKEDFYLNHINIEMEGKSNRRISNFRTMLKHDLLSYKFQLLLFIGIYIIVFCTNSSTEGLENLNETFIDIISIFIGMLFVFATMFYKKDELHEAIKNGKAQEIFLTDKYIFVLAMVSLVLVIVSNGILKYEVSSNIIAFKELMKQNYEYIYWIIKYGISQMLTGISIIFNYICFRSIIDYYLTKIKSKAINQHIKEIKEEIGGKYVKE